MIEMGFCQCGCGHRTNLAPETDASKCWIKGQPMKFILYHRPLPKGENHYRWKGGKRTRKDGYAELRLPEHHRARDGGYYVFEHILIAEKALGKAINLPHVVHHFPDLNSKQLVICENQAYHLLLHKRYKRRVLSRP